MAKYFTFIFSLLIAFTAAAQSDDIQPKGQGLVNDFIKVLSPSEKAALESKLENYEDSTSTQIAVIIEGPLKNKTPYDRAMAYARDWGVGSKEKNNGVVLYIAISDNKEERGYFTVTSQATQGKLTDAIIGEIEREFLVPNFRQKKYYEGIDAVTTAYIEVLRGEFVAGKGKKEDNVPGWVILLVIFGLIFFIGIFNNARHGRGYRSGGSYWFPGSWGGGSSGWGGGSSGGGGWGGFGGGGGFDGGGAGGNW